MFVFTVTTGGGILYISAQFMCEQFLRVSDGKCVKTLYHDRLEIESGRGFN